MTARVLKALSPIMMAARRTEQIARDVSKRQAELATTAGLRQALRQQSCQEAAHAAGFDAALQYLGESSAPLCMLDALEDLADRLHADLDRGDLPSSMIGLQYVLEGLGSIALEPPPGDLARLGDKFVPLRKLVLQQEMGHRRLGEVWVPRFAAALSTYERSRLSAAGRDYAALANAVVEAGLPLLEGLDTDRDHYLRASRAFVTSLYDHPLVSPPIEEFAS